jgi:uncharacterized repeat protein (TIGR04076 family)
MQAVRITVLKRALHEDLARAHGGREIRPCEVLREGQTFLTGFQKPDGFCDWAWTDVSRGVVALLTGGTFDRGVFQGWMRTSGSLVACCSDGFRPVSFLLERIDTLDLLELSGVERPAPRAVYGSERWGECSYALAGLAPGAPGTLRLHLAEIYHSAAGRRSFHVDVNGRRALEGLDVFAAAGGAHRALVRELPVVADAEGKVTVRFVKGAADEPKASGLELYAEGAAAPVVAVNCGGPAVEGFSADAGFTGGNVTGA